MTGMQIDFCNYLEDLEQIDEESVTVERNRDAEHMLRVSCTAAQGASLDEAATAVRDVWVSVLRYKYLQAHELRVGEGEATLDFVTQIGPHGFYVTGQVRVVSS